VAEVLNKRQTLSPVVARKYSISTGTLRYFLPVYTSSHHGLKELQKHQSPHIVFFLAEDSDAIDAFHDITEKANEMLLFALCENVSQLTSAILEVLALERIQSESPEIKTDPVASRELKDRLIEARQTESFLLTQIFEQPGQNQWVWCNKKIEIDSKKGCNMSYQKYCRKFTRKHPSSKTNS